MQVSALQMNLARYAVPTRLQRVPILVTLNRIETINKYAGSVSAAFATDAPSLYDQVLIRQTEAPTMSSQLIWQLVKNNNSFLHKGLNGINLSKEPGNLYNLHSYKHSGA